MPKPYKSLRVFKNPYLEKLTHVHPVTPLVLWTPIVAWLLWRAFFVHQLSPYLIGTLAAAGLSVWTFVEYMLHRFVFHYEGDTPIERRLHFLVHGLHHADPNDPTRLVMPPIGSIFLGIVLYGMFGVIFTQALLGPFFAFFVIGYLCYDYIHFWIHHFTPKTRIGRFLKNSHMMHHYVSPNSRWGVSSPFWDYIFGTLEDVKDRQQAV